MDIATIENCIDDLREFFYKYNEISICSEIAELYEKRPVLLCETCPLCVKNTCGCKVLGQCLLSAMIYSADVLNNLLQKKINRKYVVDERKYNVDRKFGATQIGESFHSSTKKRK